jgi:hypothetical protein
MHRSRVRDEIETRPRVPREELRRQQISLQAIATPARQNEVAGDMRAAVR